MKKMKNPMKRCNKIMTNNNKNRSKRTNTKTTYCLVRRPDHPNVPSRDLDPGPNRSRHPDPNLVLDPGLLLSRSPGRNQSHPPDPDQLLGRARGHGHRPDHHPDQDLRRNLDRNLNRVLARRRGPALLRDPVPIQKGNLILNEFFGRLFA